MADIPPEAPPCSACVALINGSRSHQGPHEYLVFARGAESTATALYKCLVCKRELGRQDDGPLPRWKLRS